MFQMDSHASAYARYMNNPGLYQLVVRDVDVATVRAMLPWWWSYRGPVTVEDGYPENGGRFIHGPFMRILMLALNRRWDLLWPWERSYALSRGVR